MTTYEILANSIEGFDVAVNNCNDGKVILIDSDTEFTCNELTIARNKLITGLKSAFITVNGYINIPALLSFCYTHGFTYSGINSIATQSSFTINHNRISVKVSIG